MNFSCGTIKDDQPLFLILTTRKIKDKLMNTQLYLLQEYMCARDTIILFFQKICISGR